MHQDSLDTNPTPPADQGGTLARISGELIAHSPFSVSSVAIGLVLAGLICVVAPVAEETVGPQAVVAVDGPNHDEHGHSDPGRSPGGFSRPLFHLFHPVHMFFSAAATTAMFWRYERRLVKAVLIGILGAVGVCGVSDILMPYASQLLLVTLGKLDPGTPLRIHICIVHHPDLVVPFAIIGVAVGLSAAMVIERSTLFSHSLHVFSSTMASIFYLIGPFGRTGWFDLLGLVFLLVVLAVMIPCCVSDIIFPLALTRSARDEHAKEPHHHH